jgi:hypothetical protein
MPCICICRLQFPFFIAKSYSFPYLQMPKFRNLKALHVHFQIEAVSLPFRKKHRTFPSCFRKKFAKSPNIVPNCNIWALCCIIGVSITSWKFRIWWHFINSSDFLPWKFSLTLRSCLIFLNYW